ncbi:MAG: S-layer homology domain-containing protein [Oscillospiraceae bacterium]
MSPGIQTDRDQHTITVPIVATESTNGLFHVEYDPDALALVSVNPGAVLNRYDTSTAGKIRMGYADANEINGVIANLVFRYTPGDEAEETDLILSVVEDGATSAGTTEAVKITLPEDPFPERFEDVQKGDWFYDDVKFVYNQNLMVGVSETRFAPNATANRAMIATVLYRLAGTPTYTTENPYTDLKQGSYYYDAVLWCTENGIFEGYGNGKFGPMDAVTREQLAAVLYRYTEKYLDMDASSRVVLKDVYRDYEKISRWAEDGMSWASATGLMEGYPDGTVRPRNGEKRSEIAAMFHRYCVNILDV